ncbi:hypothetical protein CHS0354_041676 [Potamilus streckersoni]|uniref:C1q domain-containing protein n=1 Tax=Potamilus streckersoni TaxID=2493646 RepID=A0AAE0SCK2_9BIVA|nr:hypothetical protein CHS0354_041676 [Potamilus streckersoni]
MTWIIFIQCILLQGIYTYAGFIGVQDDTDQSIIYRLEKVEQKVNDCDLKLDRFEQLEKRLMEAEKVAEKVVELEHNLRLANIYIKKSEDRINELEKTLNSGKVTDITDSGDNEGMQTRKPTSLDRPYDPELKVHGSLKDISTFNDKKVQTIERSISDFRERRATNVHVAFSVYWSSCTQTSLSQNSIIEFDQIQYNAGNAFDVHSHTFTCPLTGTYHFTNVMTGYQEKIETAIVLEGAVKAIITTGGNVGQGGNTVTIHCRKGERVWVKAWSKFGIGSLCVSSPYSTFSGFLLWEDPAPGSVVVPTHAAFSVYWSSCTQTNITADSVVGFDQVLYNEGNGFDLHSNSFMCPVTGAYQFTNVMTGYRDKVETAIVLDDITKAIVTTGGGVGQGSNTVVVTCRKGQRVWVRAWNSFSVGSLCVSSPYSTFSGFLLWEETGNNP